MGPITIWISAGIWSLFSSQTGIPYHVVKICSELAFPYIILTAWNGLASLFPSGKNEPTKSSWNATPPWRLLWYTNSYPELQTLPLLPPTQLWTLLLLTLWWSLTYCNLTFQVFMPLVLSCFLEEHYFIHICISGNFSKCLIIGSFKINLIFKIIPI